MSRQILPCKYIELADKNDQHGLHLTDEILDPIVFFARDDQGKLTVQLGAAKYVRGVETFLYAPSEEHDFVLNGNDVFPLPSDIHREIRDFFYGKKLSEISTADVLKARLSPPATLECRIRPSVFNPAKDTAHSLGENFEVTDRLNAKLYGYQRDGVAWLLATLGENGGVILADEMGLGKTVQVIASLITINPTKDQPVLIICPTSLIANWCQEIARFAPTFTTAVHRGGERAGIAASLKTAEIILSTYDTVVIDQSLFKAIRWSCIVCDEAQAIKNPQSRRRMVLASLHADHRILMTGTPVETSLTDLWSLADICVPNLLGDQRGFNEAFPDTEDGAERLNEVLSPLMLKRTVAEVAGDLPERIDIELPMELGDALAAEYDQIRQTAYDEFERAGALVAAARLSVFCAHPHIETASFDPINPDEVIFQRSTKGTPLTPKLELSYSLISEAVSQGKKILVFSIYNHIGPLIRGICQGLHIPYWNSINGSTPQELRQKIIDEFSREKGSSVLILNPKAAGAGLNITAATIVIHYTPNWNPALEMQASARAHRRGQVLPVTIYQLYYKDTIEQIMIERSHFRKTLGDLVVPDASQESHDLHRAIQLSPQTKTT